MYQCERGKCLIKHLFMAYPKAIKLEISMKIQFWQTCYVPSMFSYFCSIYKTSLITLLIYHCRPWILDHTGLCWHGRVSKLYRVSYSQSWINCVQAGLLSLALTLEKLEFWLTVTITMFPPQKLQDFCLNATLLSSGTVLHDPRPPLYVQLQLFIK